MARKAFCEIIVVVFVSLQSLGCCEETTYASSSSSTCSACCFTSSCSKSYHNDVGKCCGSAGSTSFCCPGAGSVIGETNCNLNSTTTLSFNCIASSSSGTSKSHQKASVGVIVGLCVAALIVILAALGMFLMSNKMNRNHAVPSMFGARSPPLSGLGPAQAILPANPSENHIVTVSMVLQTISGPAEKSLTSNGPAPVPVAALNHDHGSHGERANRNRDTQSAAKSASGSAHESRVVISVEVNVSGAQDVPADPHTMAGVAHTEPVTEEQGRNMGNDERIRAVLAEANYIMSPRHSFARAPMGTTMEIDNDYADS